MNIIPAIDLIGGKAVRLMKGDYNRVTVYHDHPEEVAKSFEQQGAQFLHIVDLDGAKDGNTANFETIRKIVQSTTLSVEVGGGIRSLETVKKYADLGVSRVIIGTAAVTDPQFLEEAMRQYPDHIAVGIDIKDGMVAIKGWLETSSVFCEDFFAEMQALGVRTVICTDVSKDGAMKGTNLSLYRILSRRFSVDIVASGGVSSLEDVKALREMGLYGAIVGKAYYTGAIDLKEAIEVAK